MAIRKIREIGDEVLNKECRSVEKMTPHISELIDDMFETMYETNGVGLAAPQVGVTHSRTCPSTRVYTHLHTHTYTDLLIFLKRLPIKTPRKFTAMPTGASQGLQVPKKEEVIRKEVA